MLPNPFTCVPTRIPGCLEIRPIVHNDCRGRFVKVFHREAFAAHGLCTEYDEEFYSISFKDVIRGLHYQRPPADHVKLVYCVEGEVEDAAVDLRVGSPTYGQHILVRLSASDANMLYIPRGVAHGFCTLTEKATLVYRTTTTHSPEHDSGVLWNSANIRWSATTPIVSDRDRAHIPLADLISPFTYRSEA